MPWHWCSQFGAASALLLVAGGGCAPEEGTESGSSERPPAVAVALSMALAQPSDSIAVAGALARALAIALGSKAMRHDLRSLLLQSEVKEHKLHLQRFLRHAGSQFESTLAQQAGVPAGRWADLAERLVDMELYMPVKEQWQAWDGAAEVLVAAVYEKDEAYVARGSQFTGYDGLGRAVALSLEAPPSYPVLVLARAEGRFDETGSKPPLDPAGAQCTMETCGTGGPGGPPAPAVKVVASQLSDDGESWPNGDPELTIAVQVLSASGQYSILSNACSHEQMPAEHYFNQDALAWSGSTTIITVASLEAQTAANRYPVFIMWEDDTGDKCAFSPENPNAQAADQVATAGLYGTVATLAGAVPGGQALALLFGAMTIAGFVYPAAFDDYIGVAGVPLNLNPYMNPRTVMSLGVSGSITLIVE